MSIEKVEIIKVVERKVWIEDDIAGSKHVMIQHDDCKSEPFCYCTFNYSYAHTSNSTIRTEAELMAVRMGAKEPVEYRHRELVLPITTTEE